MVKIQPDVRAEISVMAAPIFFLHLNRPDLDIMRGLKPPDGLSATLNKSYLFSFLHHSLLLYIEIRLIF